MRSFTLGDFGQMYPIARGTAPLVVTVLAAVFVGESPDGSQLGGVLSRRRGWSASRCGASGLRAPAPLARSLAALATGLSIAAYTVVDGVGVRASGSPVGYIAWLMILEGLPSPPTRSRPPG